MGDDTTNKIINIQNTIEAISRGECPMEELEKLFDIELSDLAQPGTEDAAELLENLHQQLKIMLYELLQKLDEESLETQQYLMQQFENSKKQRDVAMPLYEKLNDDSSQHSKNDSPHSPIKHLEELDLGLCEEVMESVDSAQISPHVSDDGIDNTATDPIAFEDNSKSYDSSHKSLTSLSERPNIDPTNASKENLPNNGTAEGTQQERTGSSAVDGDGGAKVAVNEDDHTLKSEQDRKPYSAFDKTDYKLSHGVLFCRVCEKNVHSINSDHVKSKVHRQKLRKAFISPTRFHEVLKTEGWQVTTNGLLRCYLCQKDCNIREHCSSDAHVLSKKYKTCPRIQTLKRRAFKLWRKLPMTIFDELLTLRLVNIEGSPAEASFCVGCDERFNTHAERERHGRESEEHHGWMDALRRSDPFSYSFGILPKKRREKDRPLRYCMLCKTGMTNSLELDNHVHGADSLHYKRLRLFFSKVIPKQLDSNLWSAFPNPVQHKASYTLEMLPQKRLYYFENWLHVIVISTDGYSLCSLCDEYVCSRSMRSHCDSVMHVEMFELFLRTLRKTNKSSGIIRKGNLRYCVFCHVAFSNTTERLVHQNSKEPHLKRALMFYKLYARII